MAANRLKRYQIIREIARSNDIVYEAHDPQTGRRIAIKELSIPPTLTGQARHERIERFRREGRAAGTLSPHPHIVTIFDVDHEGDRYFIAMEYLEGKPLRDLLQMNGALPVERARQTALQVCDALEHAHARGVIHRDIKPDNIHILPGDVVKLTDFGIARISADPSITSDGQVFGTPSYMSPEQIAGKAVDARTDIYSLGVTLYEMLTGRKPFTGDSVVTITYNIMNQEPPPMPGVPPDLQQVVFRAMAKAPEDRYQSAAAMRQALQGARTTVGAGAAAAATILPGSAPPPLATPHTPPAGPEPTQPEPPPLYLPRRPSTAAQGLRRHGHFLSVLMVAVVLALASVLFIWAASKAYQSYQTRAREAQAALIVRQGVELFHDKRYAEAVREFRRAIELAPGSETARIASSNAAAALIEQGNALLKRRPTQAVELYQAALQYEPRSVIAYYGLGMAYHNLNRFREAISAWEWVIQNAPDDPVAAEARHSVAVVYFNLGMQALSRGRYEEATAAWERCINTDPLSDVARMAEAERERLLGHRLGIPFP